MIHSPAFELLRKHHTCEAETQDFVMRRIGNSISQNELFNVFENGISGMYGKLYKADPQTLIGWVDEYRKTLKTGKNYLQTGLMDVNVSILDQRYPSSLIEWQKEVNKCFEAHLRGVTENYFHPDIYDRLVLDGKLKSGSMKENLPIKNNYEDEDYNQAKQITVKMYFIQCQLHGFTNIYYVG
jgi:hypothetical protein